MHPPTSPARLADNTNFRNLFERSRGGGGMGSSGQGQRLVEETPKQAKFCCGEKGESGTVRF